MDVTFEQSKFNEVLERYVEAAAKDLATVLNTKAYYIARKSLWFTKKAEPKTIRAIQQSATTKRERAPATGGLLIGAMINKRLGKGKGLYGPPMTRAITSFTASRLRSVAFMKSGWLPAIRGLAQLAENPGKAGPMDSNVMQLGAPKGSYRPAYSASLTATIENAVHSQTNTEERTRRMMEKGLAFAFEDEAASMEEYILKKLNERAAEANKQL